MRTHAHLLCTLLLLAVGAGCTLDGGRPPHGRGSSADHCSPGSLQTCLCVDGGAVGTRACGPEGRGFSSCLCTDLGAACACRCDCPDGGPCDCRCLGGCECAAGIEEPCGQGGSLEGECRPSSRVCRADGRWGPCQEGVGPSREICDGLDNDCDGLTDEAGDLGERPAVRSQGVCAGLLMTCAGPAGWQEPDYHALIGPSYEPGELSCDGLDNDCDGQTDEGNPEGGARCGQEPAVGLCRPGVLVCEQGELVCLGASLAMPELCDGLDNDCDGQTDEELDELAPLSDLHMGVCQGQPRLCAGPQRWIEPDYGRLPGYEPRELSCDGLDNDCNGTVDQGCPCQAGQTRPCGYEEGACEPGEQICGPDGWSPCAGGVPPESETCDGLDNDCDGETDELGVCD